MKAGENVKAKIFESKKGCGLYAYGRGLFDAAGNQML